MDKWAVFDEMKGSFVTSEERNDAEDYAKNFPDDNGAACLLKVLKVPWIRNDEGRIFGTGRLRNESGHRQHS
jgi:hypothetical protein